MQQNKRPCTVHMSITVDPLFELVWSIDLIRVCIIGWTTYYEQLDRQVVCMEDFRKTARVIKIWLDAHVKDRVNEESHREEVTERRSWWSEGVRILSPYTIQTSIFDREDMIFGEKGTWGALKVQKQAIYKPCFVFKREKHDQCTHVHRVIIMKKEDMDPLYRYLKASKVHFIGGTVCVALVDQL